MKNLKLLMVVAFVFGAAIGSVSGFNPMASGATTVVLSLLGSGATGVVTTGIDLTAVVAQLGAYISKPENAKGIWVKMFQQLELIQYMRRISGQKGSYTGMKSTNTEVLQAFQKAFTPKDGVAFVPYLNTVYRAKVDFLLDNMDEIVDSYLHFLADESKDRKDWPLVKYIVDKHILPQMVEDLNIAMCRGSFVAPTPGTAGNSIATMNGLQTIVTAEITATNIVPIVTGAITASDGLDKIELFADGIDPLFSDKGGVIFCSKSVERFYKSDYRATFGTQNSQEAKNNTKLDNYNIELVGLSGWGTSQRLLFTPTGATGNLLYLYDKIFTPSSFEVQKEDRSVKLLTDFHTGVGFNTLDAVFVNDQA